MYKWITVFLLTLLLGIVKGAHFIKLVVLAGLGLAGLWMVHTLAQDFSTVQNSGGSNINSNGVSREVYKRSIELNDRGVIDWEMVLSRDPAGCARSFLCQLSATEKELLSDDELLMMKVVKYSTREDTWASRQLQKAMKSGEKLADPSECMNIYKFCPYSSHIMMALLKIFGR